MMRKALKRLAVLWVSLLLLSACGTPAPPSSLSMAPTATPSPEEPCLRELLWGGAAGQYDARLTTLEGILSLYGEEAGDESLEEVFGVYPFDDCVLVRSGPQEWREVLEVGEWCLYCLPLGRGAGIGQFYGEFYQYLGKNNVLLYLSGMFPNGSDAGIPLFRRVSCDPQGTADGWFSTQDLPFYENGLNGDLWPDFLEGKARRIGTGMGLDPMEVSDFQESEDAFTFGLRILSGNPPPGGGNAPLVWTQIRHESADGDWREVLTVRVENTAWSELDAQPKAIPLEGKNKFCREFTAYQGDGEMVLRFYLPARTYCSVLPSVIDMTEGTLTISFAEEF